jgi:Calcineurin-like phosphoesterase superfamily domain
LRIQLLSDLHLEKRAYDKDWLRSLRQSRVDVTVFAGDVMHLRDKKRVTEMLGVMAEFAPHIIYVLGNHDHRSTTPTYAQATLSAAALAFPEIHVFSSSWNTWTHPGGQRFVGGTMRYSRAAVAKVAQPDAGLMIKSGNIFSDFHFIIGLAPWVYEQNAAFTSGLEADLRADDIVVTPPADLSKCARSLSKFFNKCILRA